MIRKFLFTAAVAVAAALTAPSTSQAAFTLTINNLLSATDGGAGDNDNILNGIIDYRNTVAGYDLQINAQVTNNGTGFGGTNILNTAIIARATSTATQPLVITTFADNLTFPLQGNPFNANLLNAAGDSQFDVGTATATSTLTPTVPPGGGTTNPVVLTAPGAQGNTTTRVVVSGNPFSLSNTLTIRNLLGTNNPTFNGTVTTTAAPLGPTLATPAPAGLLLAAFGIPAFGLLRRFGRKVDASVIA